MPYASFGKQCSLCGQCYNHDGNLVYPELRSKIFDEQGRHVVSISTVPMKGWNTDNGICVHCLTNLGLYHESQTENCS